MQTLSKEDKKSLESIIREDVFKAQTKIKQQTTEKIKNLSRNPSKEVEKLLVEHAKLFIKIDAITKKIKEKTGGTTYTMTKNGNTTTTITEYSYGDLTGEVKKLKEIETERIEKLDKVKRDYSIKLFSNGTEITKLLKDLAEDIKKLI